MYVVRKPFRNCGQMMLPGSHVEPGSIKWFKTRLKDRVIVEVNAHNFDKWNEYFVGKFGVAIAPEHVEPAEAAEKEVVPEKVVIKKVVAAVKA